MKKISSDSERLLSLQDLKDAPTLPEIKRMSTDRCAKLMVIGMANNLDEVWISENPSLLMVYLNQYLPNLFRWYVAHYKRKVILRWYSWTPVIKTQFFAFWIPCFSTLWHFFQHCFILSFLSPGFQRSSLWKLSWAQDLPRIRNLREKNQQVID